MKPNKSSIAAITALLTLSATASFAQETPQLGVSNSLKTEQELNTSSETVKEIPQLGNTSKASADKVSSKTTEIKKAEPSLQAIDSKARKPE